MENKMLTIPEDYVCIPLEVYDDLMTESNDFALLKSCLFQNCDLGYRGDSLLFDSSAICLTLSLLDYNRYKNTLNRLKEEAEDAGTDQD